MTAIVKIEKETPFFTVSLNSTVEQETVESADSFVALFFCSSVIISGLSIVDSLSFIRWSVGCFAKKENVVKSKKQINPRLFDAVSTTHPLNGAARRFRFGCADSPSTGFHSSCGRGEFLI
jgi:hypothetical protein